MIWPPSRPNVHAILQEGKHTIKLDGCLKTVEAFLNTFEQRHIIHVKKRGLVPPRNPIK